MEAIAEHRAAGGRIAVATHLPLPLPGAEAIRLDDYAVSPMTLSHRRGKPPVAAR